MMTDRRGCFPTRLSGPPNSISKGLPSRSSEATAHVRRYTTALVRLGDLVMELQEEESAVLNALLTLDTTVAWSAVAEHDRSGRAHPN